MTEDRGVKIVTGSSNKKNVVGPTRKILQFSLVLSRDDFYKTLRKGKVGLIFDLRNVTRNSWWGPRGGWGVQRTGQEEDGNVNSGETEVEDTRGDRRTGKDDEIS